MSLLPGAAKRLEPFPPTFGAGTVPGCQSGCFVEEEEFGVTTWRHHLPLAAPKLQHTHEPSLSLPLPPDAAFIVMENTTIAHECSPLRRGNDLTKRIHTILSGHRHYLVRLAAWFGTSGCPQLLSKMKRSHLCVR